MRISLITRDLAKLSFPFSRNEASIPLYDPNAIAKNIDITHPFQ
jgi:hypothetical protein